MSSLAQERLMMACWRPVRLPGLILPAPGKNRASDDNERILADDTVDEYIAAIGRRLPRRQVEHKTWGGPLDLTIGLAAIIPEARAEFIDKQLGPPTETALRGHDRRDEVNESQAWVRRRSRPRKWRSCVRLGEDRRRG